MAGIVIRISRPNEAVIGDVVPFFGRRLRRPCNRCTQLDQGRTQPRHDRARRYGDADSCFLCLRRSWQHWSTGVMEDWSDGICDSRTTFHYSITPTLHHSTSEAHSFPSIAWPPPLCPFRKDRSSGCKIVGPVCGAYLLRNSANADPRGRHPGTMLQVSALASMIVTFGSPEIVRRSFAAPPRTRPAVP
jgi:hypothetical protein